MNILVLNAGSSSQKSCLYAVGGNGSPAAQPKPLWEAQSDASSPIGELLEQLWIGPTAVRRKAEEVDVVGHRIVHGGGDFREPALVNEEVKAAIARWASLAPDHNPAALAGIAAVEKLLPGVPQVAVFDTAFHATLNDAAAVYPIPFAWTEEGVRRYGFHGISHEDGAARAAGILGRDLRGLRIVSCHLGNGCSLCAIDGGRSVDTTMGFTPLEGLMMGTRSGSVDPGVLLYLLRERGVTADELDRMFNHESGLKGVSGLSGDLRDIVAAIAQGNARAKLAFDVYIHRLRAGVGAMLATLRGMDALVFTGGVGEHSAAVRAGVCEAFGFVGLAIDDAKNEGTPTEEDIALPSSKVRVVVVEAQEDWAIACKCWAMARS